MTKGLDGKVEKPFPPHPMTSSQDLIDELRHVMDDALSHIETHTGKNYAKTREAFHDVFELAKSCNVLYDQTLQQDKNLNIYKSLVAELQEIVGQQKLLIEAKPDPLQIMQGSILVPVTPTPEILNRFAVSLMGGGTMDAGLGVATALQIYNLCVEAVLKE